MIDVDLLYQLLGQKIRIGRERAPEKLSQDKLAKRLGISRASVVNIEAGRQHAPLHTLWHIAEELGTDLSALIPRRSELAPRDIAVQLSETMLLQIERETKGNPELQKNLAGQVGRLLSTLDFNNSTGGEQP